MQRDCRHGHLRLYYCMADCVCLCKLYLTFGIHWESESTPLRFVQNFSVRHYVYPVLSLGYVQTDFSTNTISLCGLTKVWPNNDNKNKTNVQLSDRSKTHDQQPKKTLRDHIDLQKMTQNISCSFPITVDKFGVRWSVGRPFIWGVGMRNLWTSTKNLCRHVRGRSGCWQTISILKGRLFSPRFTPSPKIIPCFQNFNSEPH